MQLKPADVCKMIKANLASAVMVGIALVIFSSACHYLLYDVRRGNQASGVGSLRTLEECAAMYSHWAHLGPGYPASMVLMGPRGSDCIDRELAVGMKNGYQFTYTPGPEDARGRIKTYEITARPLKYGRTGDLSFFTDESGEIRVTREDRPATAEDPPLGQ